MTSKSNHSDKHTHKFTIGLAVVAVALSVVAISIYRLPELFWEEECLEEECFEIRTLDFTISPNSLAERTVSCEADEVVTGGGFRITDDPKLFVWKNVPSGNGKGWSIGISNYGTSTRSVTVYAICVKVK